MTEHPNAALLRRAYTALADGDLVTLGELMTGDAVHHYPGRSPLAGSHKGKDEVFAFLAKLFELTGGAVRVEPVDIAASDEHSFALVSVHYERNGTALDTLAANIARVRDGQIAELWTYPADLYALDEFWADSAAGSG